MKTLQDLIQEAHEIIPRISCLDFWKRSDSFTVIDVREGTEVEESGKIEAALNIPRGLIEMKLSPNSGEFDADTPIVVYCGGGSRAALAGKTLKELGFKNVHTLEGGYRGWKKISS